MSGADADDVTTDDFLGGRLKIRQPRAGYRAGIDAVLAAAAVPAGDGERVLDCGSGVGVIGLALAVRCAGAHVVLVDREPAFVALARENIAANGLDGRVACIEADVTCAIDDPLLAAGSFHHVVANPPYQTIGQGRSPSTPLRAAAHEMAVGDLDRWARFLARVAAADGTCTIIHRADALAAVLAALDGRFGALLLLAVHPRIHEPAVRVIVQGRKGSRAPLAIAPPLVLHEADGRFRDPIVAVARGGAALPMLR